MAEEAGVTITIYKTCSGCDERIDLVEVSSGSNFGVAELEDGLTRRLSRTLLVVGPVPNRETRTRFIEISELVPFVVCIGVFIITSSRKWFRALTWAVRRGLLFKKKRKIKICLLRFMSVRLCFFASALSST